MKKLRWGRSTSNNFIRWSCLLLAIIVLSLAFATCLAGTSHATSVDRLYAVSFNGSQYPPGTGLVNDMGNVSGNIYLYAIDPAGGRILWNLLLNESAYYIVASPSGERLYLTNGLSRNVTLVDPVNRTRAGTFSLNGSASGIALSPDGSLLYVAMPDRQAIYALNAADGVVRMVVAVNNTPYDLTLSPDGKTIYATDSRNGSVAVVDVPGRRQLTALRSGARPLDVATSPDGEAVFVANYDDNTIAVFNARTYTLKLVIGDVMRPSYLVAYTAQNWVFATSFTDGNLTQIDAAQNRVATTLPVGSSSLGKPVVSSDGAKIFVPEGRYKSILAMNAASLASLTPLNFTNPVLALAMGTATQEETVVTTVPTPGATLTPTTVATPNPTPEIYIPGNWGTPTPFYIPLPIPPKVSPVALGGDPGIFGVKPFFEPIIINSISQNDVIFILLIFTVILVVLCGITYIMMFRKDDDD